MNLWKTLGLLVVFVGLLVWCLKFEQGDKPDHESDKTLVELLGFKRAEDIVEVTVGSGAGSFTLRKEKREGEGEGEAKDGWDIVAPLQGRGDDASIEAYVKTLLTTKVQHRYSAEQAKSLTDSDIGLAQPRATLTLKDAAGREATMLFGEAAGNETGYYARPKDGEGLLIFSYYFVNSNLVEKKLGDLRDKTLLRFLTADVEKLTLKYPARTIEVRKKDGSWIVMADGRELAADSGAIESLLSNLSGARIDEFVDASGDLGAYGLAQPRIEVTLALGAKGEQGLLLGATRPGEPEPAADPYNQQPPAEKLYVQRRGDDEVLLVAGTLYDQLLKTVDDLRDKVVLDLNTQDVTKLAYSLDGATVELVKQPGKGDDPATWQLVKPTALKADKQVVEELLSNIDLLRATGFVDEASSLAAYGLDEPRGRIEISEGDKKLPVLLIGSAAENGADLFVKREDRPTIYKVRASFTGDLETKPERLRDLVVLALDRTLFKKISLRQANGDLLVLEATGANEWKLTKPEAKEVDSGRVSVIVTTLAEVHADEWVTDRTDEATRKTCGLDNPDVIATVELSNGKKETLYVAADPGGSLSAFLKRKGRNDIFKSDHGLILSDLRKSPQDLEPLPEEPMGGMPPF